MARFIVGQINFTNVMLAIIGWLGILLGNQIISNQVEMQKDITAIKVSVGIGDQKNKDQDSDIKRLQDLRMSNKSLFKNEPIFTFNTK